MVTRKNNPLDPDKPLYKWTCPICDATQISPSDADRPIEKAFQALKSHIRAANGDGHGPQYSLPRDFTRSELRLAVKRLDS